MQHGRFPQPDTPWIWSWCAGLPRASAPPRPPRSSASWRDELLSPGRLIAEFLAADGGLIHEASLRDREHGHSLVVGACGRRLVACAGAAGGTGRSGCAGCRGRDHHRVRVRAELEAARGEFIERTFVFEENDLAVRLAAGLKSNTHLSHRGVADVLAARVYMAAAMRRADDEPSLTDGRKDCVTVTPGEEGSALTGRLE